MKRDYDRTLPKLTIRGPELNQVWTNILDNAIDALGERGTITIATRREESCAVVELSDDGPGIPEENTERIFDSFFTTKDVGKGTGLGLEPARRIVVDRHDGSLTVDSEPGRTTFRVPAVRAVVGRSYHEISLRNERRRAAGRAERRQRSPYTGGLITCSPTPDPRSS